MIIVSEINNLKTKSLQDLKWNQLKNCQLKTGRWALTSQCNLRVPLSLLPNSSLPCNSNSPNMDGHKHSNLLLRDSIKRSGQLNTSARTTVSNFSKNIIEPKVEKHSLVKVTMVNFRVYLYVIRNRPFLKTVQIKRRNSRRRRVHWKKRWYRIHSYLMK